MADFTRTFRRTTYPNILPSAPSNNQSGKTILITGGSSGIGFNIAKAYAEANASTIILVARSEGKLNEAVQTLRHDHPKVKVESIRGDVSDESDINALWTKLTGDQIFVDVLVLNASATIDTKTIDELIAVFQFNMFANLRMLESWRKQPNPTNRHCILINISSATFHCYNYFRLAYGASKASFTNYLCHLADQIPESTLRLVSLHPGSVLTPTSIGAGEIPPDLPIWDDPSLSGGMALWLSSKEAAFLHGRYVWANWDADELMAMKEKVLAEPGFMKVGVTGANSFTVPQLMEKCEEFPVPKR